MAEISIPQTQPAPRWLDRPLLPSRERLAAVAAHWELWAYVAIIAVAFVLRVYDVGARAMHHDESLHAYFSWKFFTGQGYAYDPLMHGPLQFEVVPLFYLLFGDNETSARLFAVVTGTILVGLPFYLRTYLTRPGALLAAAMLAISPAMVYFSRFIRDDMYLACFTMIMFIAIVKYLESPRPALMYIGAAAAALAMASMEAAYLTFFIFGTFLFFEGLREYVTRRGGPVLDAVRRTSLDTWLTAISVFVVITVVCYSSFFTNPYGIWDTKHSIWLPGQAWTISGLNPERKDILGGLSYWIAQHKVQRGNEPTFYYLLLLPLYEQLALVLGIAGIVYACIRRSLARTFLVWWAVMAFALYSWAGEKMPWLVVHIALPLILLAGLFLGEVLWRAWKPIAASVAVIALLLAALEVHSTFLLNFVDAANPTEMLIYVQTSQDVPNSVNEVAALSQRVKGNLSIPIGLDTNDVGGWPFIWYLRHFTNVTQTNTFAGPVCNGQNCDVMFLLGPEYDQYSTQLNKMYVAQKYRWNWWFPQDYMTWFGQNMGGPFAGKVAPITGAGTSTDWQHLWNWLMYRRRFADTTGQGARWLYVLVRRDLVPGSKYILPSTNAAAPPSSPPVHVRALSTRYLLSLGASGLPLSGPRGVATDGSSILVADPINHRIVRYDLHGRVLAAFGAGGSGPGQFATRDSPLGVSSAPNGNIYVADTWNERIEVFTPRGKFLRAFGGGPIGSGPGQFFGPRSVSVAPDGRVYVADTGNKRIQIFSPKGAYLGEIGSAGSAPGQLQEPSAVAVARDGSVYVADFWNRRIQVFSPSGTYRRSWPVPGWTFGSYNEPYISVDPLSGNIVTSDPDHGQVLVFSPTGRSLGALSTTRLSLPVGVAALGGGRIAVGDATANRVDVFAVKER